MGRFSESLDAATRALKSEPTDPLCLRLAARASAELGKHDQARKYVEQALMYPVEYSAAGTRLVDRLGALLRFGSFVPLFSRMHQRLRREDRELRHYDSEWDELLWEVRGLHQVEWSRKYLEWHRTTFDGRI
jgi:hypothetical protein